MNRSCLLITFAILLGAAMMVRPALASFSFDETTETTCLGKTCTKTLYSGFSPTFFDNVISKSSNWLKYYGVVYLEKDPNYNLELISFNATYFVVHLNVPLSQSNKQIPLKLCSENGCSNVSILMNVLDRDVTVGMNPISLSNITFGFNSTTIKLQVANTENQRDAYVYQTSDNSNYGTATTLNVRTASFRTYIMFNISSIPPSQTISNSKLCLYVSGNGTTNIISNYHVISNNWLSASTGLPLNETTITWNNQTCGTGFTNSTYCNLTAEDTITSNLLNDWECWNTTNMVNNEYISNDLNVSIILVGGGSAGISDAFPSKENGTATLMPYLNITYTAGDSTPPTYSNNQTNSTVAGWPDQIDLKWTDETALSGYMFSFDNCTGTLTNDTWVSMSGATNWSNVTKTVNSTLGCTIQWCVYANDTSNNWNGTSCSAPFSYVTTAPPSIFSATFNIAIKEKLNLPGRVILFGRIQNLVQKTNGTFSRMISAERTLNAKEKTSNSFSALLVAGLQTFERFMNIGTKAADSFFYMITGMRFLNVPTKDANQFSRTIIVTKFLNVSTKDKIDFLRNTVVEKFLNISQKESNQFGRIEIISRILNIQEKTNVSWLAQLPYNIFERLLSIPLDLIDKFIVYVRIWEQPPTSTIYQVCSILQQIGDSRAYLCIYDTGEWKILIRGV